ncbi:hypothetical protein [Sphingomonas sp. CARO-RG-8B-R24-01]|uniref:hypothetical protein n=1 Tax=Sphingomonas sp. CARO-RG-8B-R24-01 TaxID=2914831 RepID=UPI00321FDB94
MTDYAETIEVAALLRRSGMRLEKLATAGKITDATMAPLRAECPWWDYQTLHGKCRSSPLAAGSFKVW